MHENIVRNNKYLYKKTIFISFIITLLMSLNKNKHYFPWFVRSYELYFRKTTMVVKLKRKYCVLNVTLIFYLILYEFCFYFTHFWKFCLKFSCNRVHHTFIVGQLEKFVKFDRPLPKSCKFLRQTQLLHLKKIK